MTKTLWQTDIATENHHSWILLTIGKSTHLLWPCSIAVSHDQNLGYSISWPLESGSNGKMPFFKIFLPVRYEGNPFPWGYPMSSHPFNHDFSHHKSAPGSVPKWRPHPHLSRADLGYPLLGQVTPRQGLDDGDPRPETMDQMDWLDWWRNSWFPNTLWLCQNSYWKWP